MQLICPLCRESLSRDEQRWHCVHGHSFDSAREGFTHLLPVHKKKSKAPGDDKQMVNARRRFLDAGHYQLLSDAINQRVLQFHQQQYHTLPLAVIDAGCGEGYYSSRLQQHLQDRDISTDITGVDISKPACRLAAKRNRDNQWLVASNRDLPIADHNAELILCLFSPLQSNEFKRCLKSNGQLIVASTGPQHLLELREILYDKVDMSAINTDTTLRDDFENISSQQETIRYAITLNDSDSIHDLLTMTPHYWRASPARKKHLASIQQLNLSIDIQLKSYRLKSV